MLQSAARHICELRPLFYRDVYGFYPLSCEYIGRFALPIIFRVVELLGEEDQVSF